MEITIIENAGIKAIQLLNVDDVQGVEIYFPHYQEIKKLAKRLGWD